MKKIVKIIFISLASLLALLVMAAILIPVFFKEDIRKAIDAELDRQIRARVFYDVESFDLSLFKSFPNLTVSMGRFGISGEGVFEKDTLASVENFELTVNLASLLGDKITVKKIRLDEPSILVLVLEDGSANYDIMEPSDQPEETEDSEEAEGVNLAIDRWEINEGQLVYYDQSMAFYTLLNGLNHSGSGDFEADVFDMITETSITELSLGYDDVEYISKKPFMANLVMQMDMAQMKFVFSDNRISLSDFGFGFDGHIEMPEEDIDMDIRFAGDKIDLKSILSLIPGAYREYLSNIEVGGDVGFDGFVRGRYSDTMMPHIRTALNIKGGLLKMPELPQRLEKIDTEFSFDYPTGALEDAALHLDFFGEMSGQQSSLVLDLKNLVDYQWDLNLNASLDLSKMGPLLPLKDTEMRGLINAEVATVGKMADVESENWQALPTSGFLKVQDFYYRTAEVSQDVSVSKLDASFDPEQIRLNALTGRAGTSDFDVEGQLTNYLAFALGDEEELLMGRLNHNSTLLNLDEWIPETSEDSITEESSSEPLEVIRIPRNIDFIFQSEVDQIVFTGLSLEDFKGRLEVIDGAIKIQESGFSLLNGRFTMEGKYGSKSASPVFDMAFGIKGLSIPEAFKSFTPIQQWVPVADKATGSFSSDFAVNGELGQDMMPDLTSLSGSGLVEIAEATLKEIKLLSEISALTRLSDGENKEVLATLKDVILQARIDEGRLHVQPFEVKIGGYDAAVSGSNGLDGSIDYVVAMQLPSGQIGGAVNTALSQFTGGAEVVSPYVTVNMGIEGSYAQPKVRILGAQPGSGGQSALEAQVTQEVEKVKEKVEEEIEQVRDSLENEVKQTADSLKAQAKAEAKKKEEEAKKKLEKKAKNAVKDLFGRKRN
jgi:hypothetical protein